VKTKLDLGNSSEWIRVERDPTLCELHNGYVGILGIYDKLGIWQNWNCELVAQFCSTAWISGNGYESTINFSIEGHRYSLCIQEMEIPTLFGLANDDFHRANISNERTVSDNELAPLYFLGNESNYGTIHDLLP
jgi:hypothetical protein